MLGGLSKRGKLTMAAVVAVVGVVAALGLRHVELASPAMAEGDARVRPSGALVAKSASKSLPATRTTSPVGEAKADPAQLVVTDTTPNPGDTDFIIDSRIMALRQYELFREHARLTPRQVEQVNAVLFDVVQDALERTDYQAHFGPRIRERAERDRGKKFAYDAADRTRKEFNALMESRLPEDQLDWYHGVHYVIEEMMQEELDARVRPLLDPSQIETYEASRPFTISRLYVIGGLVEARP